MIKMAQRITMEEYNNSDYTKNALKELNEQMKTFKFKTTKDEKESDASSSSTEEYTPIIVTKKASKKRKSSSTTTTDDSALCALVDKLQKKLNTQSDELDTVEIRLYQKTLELSNATVSLDAKEDELKRSRAETRAKHAVMTQYRIKFYCSMALNFAFVYMCLFL